MPAKEVWLHKLDHLHEITAQSQNPEIRRHNKFNTEIIDLHLQNVLQLESKIPGNEDYIDQLMFLLQIF
jgi:hypothetical protein